MAWRPNKNLMDGELDNTTPGKVTGWLRFLRRGKAPLHVTLYLAGDCHRDLQGRRFRVVNPDPSDDDDLKGFAAVQCGHTGDMTAGDEPRDYVDYPYLEWYSEHNGRVVLELERSQLEILTGTPRFPAQALDRSVQGEHLANFLSGLVASTGAKVVGMVGTAPPRRKPRRRGAA